MSQLSLVPESAHQESVIRGFADDLFGLPVPEKMRSGAIFPVRKDIPECAEMYVPAIDSQYLFRKELCFVLQPWFWADAGNTNILMTGDTGTGKTSLIEQSAARLNWPVFRVGCHNALEFQELVGRINLNPDGSTGWSDGPLIMAMKLGGILLLDEINMLPNGAAGGLNTALDGGLNSTLNGKDLLHSMQHFTSNTKGRSAYCVPETGEMVRCHPCFRIAATGNALDGASKGKYRGVQTPNIALLDRFTLGIKMSYMSLDDEMKMLMARYPKAHPAIVTSLCEAAVGIRRSYSAGAISSILSTRVLNALIGRMVSHGDNAISQLGGLSRSLEMCLFYRMDDIDSSAMKSAIINQLELNFGDTLPKQFKL